MGCLQAHSLFDDAVACSHWPWRHFHAAVKLSRACRFAPIKRALQDRHGLPSHFSCTHTEWWSAVRYGYLPTDRKPVVDPTPLVFGGPLDLHAESQQPWSAAGHLARRAKAARETPDTQPGARKRCKSSFGKHDLVAAILDKGLSTPAAVASFAKASGGAEMQKFVVGLGEAKLKEILQHAQFWDNAEALAAEEKPTEFDRVCQWAGKPCPCESCGWAEAAKEFFSRNPQMGEAEFRHACTLVVKLGPTKVSRVPVISGASNCGKSTMLDPVDRLWGERNVYHLPPLGGSMALSSLALRSFQCLYWDDFRPLVYCATPAKAPAVPVTTFLKLFSGQAFEVSVSQSFNNGHSQVRWTKPAFLTAPSEGLWDLPAGSVVSAEDLRHIQSRLHIFTCDAKVPAHQMKAIEPCAQCWARWLLEAEVPVPAQLSSPDILLPILEEGSSDAESAVCDFF